MVSRVWIQEKAMEILDGQKIYFFNRIINYCNPLIIIK
jgi:hypothetical protein